jgi:hypothetical protein
MNYHFIDDEISIILINFENKITNIINNYSILKIYQLLFQIMIKNQ